MEGVERLRRPKPARTAPIRSWSALGTAGHTARPDAPQPPDVAAGPSGQGPPRGVHLGYRVLEDYLRQGQQAAAALGSAWAGSLGVGADSFQTLSERLLRDGLLWLEQIARLWASVDPPGRVSAAAPSPQHDAAGSGFRVEIDSRAPVEVALDLRAGAGGRPLGVHDLRSPDPEQPALAGIELTEAAGAWCVRIRVQDGQPAGRYSGIVFDRRDGSIQGTLSARVGAAGATR